jgi:uncharacterized protein DUF5317
MLLALIALAIGCALGLILGGSFRNLWRVSLRDVGLLLAGALCELAGDRWGSGWAGTVVVMIGFVLLLGFAVRNIKLTGMVLVAAGLLSNMTVIALNSGMPVRGVPAGVTYGPRHHGERPGDRLIGLADVVHIAPLGETVSAGDIVLSVGVATVVAGLMRPARREAETADAAPRMRPWIP